MAATSIITMPVAPCLVTISPYCFQRVRVRRLGGVGHSPAAWIHGASSGRFATYGGQPAGSGARRGLGAAGYFTPGM